MCITRSELSGFAFLAGEVQTILIIQWNTDGTTTEKRTSGSERGNTWGWSSRAFASLAVFALVLAYVHRSRVHGVGLPRSIPAP